MTTTILIAFAAGCASALMATSIISGVLLSVLLVFLAPLPLMVAALGWGSASALLGGLAAVIMLALSVSLSYGLNYGLTIAAPAFWLSHISLLAKPADGSTPQDLDAGLEWYPIGRVVLWAALIPALLMIFAWSWSILSGSSIEEIIGRLRDQALQSLDGVSRAGFQIENKERVASVMARALPLAMVAATVLVYLFNLWLAGRIARTSQRLRRPWPDLHSVQLPQTAMAALAAAMLLSFAGGFTGLAAQIVSAALLTAYAVVGFAVLHALTNASGGRMWWRLSAYGAIFMFFWPLLLMPMIGLLDASFGLRRRFGAPRGPSTPSSSKT